MSIRDYNQTLEIIDGLNGNVLCVCPLSSLSHDTIAYILNDFVVADLIDKHGLIIRYGYKP